MRTPTHLRTPYCIPPCISSPPSLPPPSSSPPAHWHRPPAPSPPTSPARPPASSPASPSRSPRAAAPPSRTSRASARPRHTRAPAQQCITSNCSPSDLTAALQLQQSQCASGASLFSPSLSPSSPTFSSSLRPTLSLTY
ncbi:hypothetical protein EVG20_g4939 [Dentipellis fragilis]|uniref:Uncharacterized protein n=1 Tax=Dentipellis fragilis TaxID=205917 RepID=A0A4Y9YWM8_9AGAM|nr:hypothetical protein EVG20_g4939 [Dentipellis fragilis]